MSIVNDERMQKGYFAKKIQEEEWAKQPKTLMLSKEGKAFGSYPSYPGAILVTDEPNVSGTPYFAGHAAVVQDKNYTTESFLWSTDGKPSGVQQHKNNWSGRYLNYSVYGVLPPSTSATQDALASAWASQQIGKSYNANVWNYEHDSSFYCSQLVYRAYKNMANGLDLSNGASFGWVSPMDLVYSPFTSYIYIR